MFSTAITSIFSKHKTKIFIALGVVVAVVVIVAIAKGKKSIANNQPISAEPAREVTNE